MRKKELQIAASHRRLTLDEFNELFDLTFPLYIQPDAKMFPTVTMLPLTQSNVATVTPGAKPDLICLFCGIDATF